MHTHFVAVNRYIYSACLFPPCRLPYPGGPDGCNWLLLHRLHWPSPPLHRLGIRRPTPVGSRVGSVTRLQSSLVSVYRHEMSVHERSTVRVGRQTRTNYESGMLSRWVAG